jgi:hypothetical protein
VLITDLYEGGNAEEMLTRLARLIGPGVNVIVLLALSDAGRPAYNPNLSRASQRSSLQCLRARRISFPTSWPPPCAVRICTPGRPNRTSNWSARRNERVEGFVLRVCGRLNCAQPRGSEWPAGRDSNSTMTSN